MKMKKLLFAFVAVLLSVSSFANPLQNPSQGSPICDVNAPCYYTGNAWPVANMDSDTYYVEDGSLKIKVIKQNGKFIAIVISSGNAYYVYKHVIGDGIYNHYFIKNNKRYYFKMNI